MTAIEFTKQVLALVEEFGDMPLVGITESEEYTLDFHTPQVVTLKTFSKHVGDSLQELITMYGIEAEGLVMVNAYYEINE
jgi:hypothetical protein